MPRSRRCPNQPAVFLLWPQEGRAVPFARPALLRRRLLRLLKEREKPSRLLNLRHTVSADRVPADRVGVRIARSSSTSRRGGIFPETLPRMLKLRMPPYVKIVLNNEFPRSHITTHLTRTGGPVLRAVPLARFGGAVRSAVPRPVPDAPLPGGPGPVARASRLHVWRDGDVPASVPAGGGPGGVRARGGARGGVSAHRRPLAAGSDRRIRATGSAKR